MIKKIFIFALIVIVVFGLKQHTYKNTKINHDSIMKRASHLLDFTHNLASIIVPKHFAKRHSLKIHKQQQSNSLIDFIISSKDISNTLQSGKSLDKDQTMRIVSFILSDPATLSYMIEQIDSQPGNQWSQGLSDESKKEFLRIVLTNMANQDNFDILDPTRTPPSPETINAMFDEFFSNEEMTSALLNQIDWEQLNQSLAEDEGVQWLKSVAGEDADAKNLTQDQKIAIYKAILNGNSETQNW